MTICRTATRVALAVLAALLLSSAMSSPARAQSPEALPATATSDSGEKYGSLAALHDDDLATAWHAGAGRQPGSWLKLDFGTIKHLTGYRYYAGACEWGAYAIFGFGGSDVMHVPEHGVVQYSVEGEEWTDLPAEVTNEIDAQGCRASSQEQTLPLPVRARYIRILSSTYGTPGWWWHANEFRAYGFSPSPPVPVLQRAPAVTGSPRLGEDARCSPGTWSGAPDSYRYEWRRDGVVIPGETRSTLTMTEDDVDAKLHCVVVAHNAGGDSERQRSPRRMLLTAWLPGTPTTNAGEYWRPIEHAADHDDGTLWHSYGRREPHEWVQVDFGAVTTMARYRYYAQFCGEYSPYSLLGNNGYEVMPLPGHGVLQYSVDGEEWTDLPLTTAQGEDCGASHVDHRLETPVQARYLRAFSLTYGRGGWFWTINELQGFGLSSTGRRMPAPAEPDGPVAPDQPGWPRAAGASTLAWDAVGGADSYAVERRTGSGGWVRVTETTGTTMSLAGEPEGRHVYRIVAIAAGAESVPSDPSSEILVDRSAPVVDIACAAVLHVGDTAIATVTASDAGAGLADGAPASVALDTASPGDRTATVTVADRLGHSATDSCDYAVRQKPLGGLRLAAGATPGDGAVGFAWDGAADRAVLEARDADDGAWRTLYAGPETAWTAPAPLDEGTYRVRVRADDRAVDPAPSNEVSIVVDRTAPSAPAIAADRAPEHDAANPWWRDTVTLTFAAGTDPALPDGSDGSGVDPASLPAARTFTTTGAHTASGTSRDRAGNASATASRTVRVDATAPQGTLNCPATVDAGSTASGTFFAFDSGSGLAGPATGPVALDSATAGDRGATVDVRDRVGHVTTLRCSYRVVYVWGGFRAPLEDGTVQHVVQAGAVVPVRFSLGGDRGMAIFAAPPETLAAKCKGKKRTVTETAPAGAPALAYAGGAYTAAVPTDPAWAGTCRELVLRFADGSEQRALLSFG